MYVLISDIFLVALQLRIVRGHTEEEMQLVVRNALLKEKDHSQQSSLGQLNNTVASMDAR